MNIRASAAALAECTAQLDDEDRRALRRYWARVIWEEWVPPTDRRRELPAVSDAGEVRRRREARRAMAHIAAAGKVAAVVSLPTSTPATPAVAGSGVAA